MHVSVVRESALTSPRRSSWHECQWLGCICIARLTEATRSPTRIPTSSDPADGSFLPSDSDTTGFIGGVLGGERSVEKRTTTGEGEELEGDGRSGGGRGGARGRERGGGGKSARMCGRRGKAKGTTRCNISTCSSASEQPRNLFPRLLPPLR